MSEKKTKENSSLHFKKVEILTFMLIDGEEKYTSKDNKNIVDKNEINYSDLIQTYKIKTGNDIYNNLIVDLENAGPTVKGNNTFYRAGKEAGIKKFPCYINEKTEDDKHYLQDTFDEASKLQRTYHSVVFIDQFGLFPTKKQLEEKINNSEINYPKSINITTHPRAQGIEYKITNDILPNLVNPKIEKQVQSIISKYGKIRSINGIKPKV